MFYKISLAGLTALLFSISVYPTIASPKLEGIACRSVHLSYKAEPSSLFTATVKVSESHPGTYFCVCGFNMGYFGLQELANGKKLIIFSVWDPGKQDDPNIVKEEYRVTLLHKDQAVRVGRFGNEGTGGQSFYDFDWKLNKAYRFAVKASVNDAKTRTSFSAYFSEGEDQPWKHLVTFDRPSDGQHLSGYYSFVEDFRRNRVSATKTRTAQFYDGWVYLLDGKWKNLNRAKFTGDGNPVLNINGGSTDGETMFLSTGGEIKNDQTKLWDMFELKEKTTEPNKDLNELMKEL